MFLFKFTFKDKAIGTLTTTAKDLKAARKKMCIKLKTHRLPNCTSVSFPA